jgi:hypothetical protein
VSDLWLAASATLADAPRICFVAAANIIQSAVNGPSRKTGYANYTTHSATPKSLRFRGRPASPALLIQNRLHFFPSLAKIVNLRGCNHAAILSQPIRSWKSPALNSLAAVLLLTHLLPYRA